MKKIISVGIGLMLLASCMNTPEQNASSGIEISSHSLESNGATPISQDPLDTLVFFPNSKISDSDSSHKYAISATKGIDMPSSIAERKPLTLNTGEYKAHFVIRASETQTQGAVANIYIRAFNNLQAGSSRQLYIGDFPTADYQTFTIPFSISQDMTLITPGIYYTGEASLFVENIQIEKISTTYTPLTEFSESFVFEEDIFARKTGALLDDAKALNGKAILAKTNMDLENFISFGPLSSFELPGEHRAVFRIKSEGHNPDDIVARLEVFNTDGDGVNRDLFLRGSDFQSSTEYSNFELDFIRTEQGMMEYKIYYFGNSDVSFDNVTVFGPHTKTTPTVEEDVEEDISVEIPQKKGSGQVIPGSEDVILEEEDDSEIPIVEETSEDLDASSSEETFQEEDVDSL